MLWCAYTTLTDVEAMFRSLKSGLCPVCHRKQAHRGCMFITSSPTSWWRRFAPRCAGRTLRVRKATSAEPALREKYDSLALSPVRRNAQDHDLEIHNTALCSANCPFHQCNTLTDKAVVNLG